MAGAAEDSAAFYAPIRSGSGAFKYFVDGEWRESSSGKTVPVLNPTTQQQEYAVQGAFRC
jgi:glyceraldehyde-3-phosphate dehydrogenase (NADP+)